LGIAPTIVVKRNNITAQRNDVNVTTHSNDVRNKIQGDDNNPVREATTVSSKQDPPVTTTANDTTPSNNDDTSTAAEATDLPKISAGFVHVGKTGGSTLSFFLRNGCHSFLKKPCKVVPNETAISFLTDKYYHVPDFHKLPETKHDAYIISTRDVFKRTVSAFLYHHPGNLKHYHVRLSTQEKREGPIAYRCFPTLEKFASLLTKGNSTDCDYPYSHKDIITDNCNELACAALHGRVRHFTHLFFHYRKLFDKIPKPTDQRKWYVVRNEHLWEDWFEVNEMLGEPPDSSREHPTFHARDIKGLKLPATRDISDERRDQLCKALETEYEAYFLMLQHSENMNEDDLKEAVEIGKQSCPNLDLRIAS
jgi:hypothetical protein